MLMLFLTVALVHIIALMSPGPDFFFVSQTAISRSRREAMMGVLGITCGVMVWAGVALLGLNLIFARMAWLHNIIMVGGGPVSMLDGLPDAAWRAEKRDGGLGGTAGGAGPQRTQLREGIADQSGESESDYLLRLGVFAVRG